MEVEYSEGYDVLVEKNIEMSFDFLEHLLDHPELADCIPSGAHVAILPEDDTELTQLRLRMARESSRRDGKPVLTVVRRHSTSDGREFDFSLGEVEAAMA